MARKKSATEQLHKKVDDLPKLREVVFMGVTCMTPRMCKKDRDAFIEEYSQPETDNKRMAELLCSLLLDPATEEPIFTPEYAINEMPDEWPKQIVMATFGSGVERAEKN